MAGLPALLGGTELCYRAAGGTGQGKNPFRHHVTVEPLHSRRQECNFTRSTLSSLMALSSCPEGVCQLKRNLHYG